MANDLAQHLAEWVKAELKRTGGTQQQLADHLGMTQPNISRRLRGASPFTLAEMTELAAFFDVTVPDLIGGPAAGNSGQYTVSPAPTPGPRASREAESGKDRPAATDEHYTAAGAA